MSEFKFACPVCGQHITADSSASGGQLECPTCFQALVIPQAPASGDSKLILSATLVGKARPISTDARGEVDFRPRDRGIGSIVATIAFFALIAGVGATVFIYRAKIFKTNSAQANADRDANKGGVGSLAKVYAIPTNFSWSLDLTNLVYPTTGAAGSVHGSGFSLEKATLQGGNLTLRQGRSWPPDLGVSVQFFAQQGEELSGKTIEIAADREPPIPKVTVRWKDEQQQAVTKNITAGYALRVAFGDANSGRMPGRIYLCLPDDSKSFIAGVFDAEIRKPPAPKPKQPKVQKAIKPGG